MTYMKRLLLLICAMTASLTMFANEHFINDITIRNNTTTTFNRRINIVGKNFFNVNKQHLNTEEIEALQFLYAYMPLADITDYPTSFFADNVKSALQARKEMSWGKNVPELLFRHFVLPVRVNNEALDASRSIFYNELKKRVNGLSMKDAILEVNHWCHEKVTYQPSDARTSSPLATIKTATGRCGEQSTFAVAALRAIGIPARQVYTPRWAHTDDNHAWVEVWADGEWYFIGACEPEPVLNLGWFNAPASRGMLMHTRAFGDYNGTEEVLSRTSNYTEINLTSNYAPTSKLVVEVTDINGKLIENARVDFKIYNYAEFYSAVTKYTGTNGKTSLNAGQGDMMIWASKNGKYGFKKVSFGKDQSVRIQLDHSTNNNKQQNTFVEDTFDIVPPREHANTPYVSAEMRAENQRRFAQEDSIRKAYTATFLTKEQAAHINPRATEYLIKARGNKQTIIDFISRHQDNEDRTLGILSTLSDKDLRDITTEILEDNFTANTNQLSPRVEDEMITIPFKNYFEKIFDKKLADKFRNDPTLIAKWIVKNIRMNPDSKALSIAQTPVGVMKSKMTDKRSRDIFFVDVARSLGIEARKDVVTGKVQYKKDGMWCDIKFENEKQVNTPTGTLQLTYSPTKYLDNPKYYNHFTISKINNGITQLMNFEEGQADMGNGTNWENTFKDGCVFDAGTYMLTTGTRLANGSVLASNTIFNIEQGKTTTLPLNIRQSATEISVIGTFNSESLINKDGNEVSILSQTGRGYYIIGVIGVGQEPTNHALHDIEKEKAAFEKWQRPMILLFENEDDAKKFNYEEFANLPSTIQFAVDKDGSIRQQIAREMKLANQTQMPMFIIADTFNRVVFVSQGYTIGLGEQLKRVFDKL